MSKSEQSYFFTRKCNALSMSKTFDLSIFDDPIGKTITEKFVRKCPNKRQYIDRLINELKLIVKKEFFEYILQVVELLDLVKSTDGITIETDDKNFFYNINEHYKYYGSL
jgi:DNA polymerase III alpha subunit